MDIALGLSKIRLISSFLTCAAGAIALVATGFSVWDTVAAVSGALLAMARLEGLAGFAMLMEPGFVRAKALPRLALYAVSLAAFVALLFVLWDGDRSRFVCAFAGSGVEPLSLAAFGLVRFFAPAKPGIKGGEA